MSRPRSRLLRVKTPAKVTTSSFIGSTLHRKSVLRACKTLRCMRVACPRIIAAQGKTSRSFSLSSVDRRLSDLVHYRQFPFRVPMGNCSAIRKGLLGKGITFKQTQANGWCCNQYIFGPSCDTSFYYASHSSKLKQIVASCQFVLQSIHSGSPSGSVNGVQCCHAATCCLLPNVAASRLRCLWAS